LDGAARREKSERAIRKRGQRATRRKKQGDKSPGGTAVWYSRVTKRSGERNYRRTHPGERSQKCSQEKEAMWEEPWKSSQLDRTGRIEQTEKRSQERTAGRKARIRKEKEENKMKSAM
jgi:hypothetical protein